MSVVVRGMRMPTRCLNCPMYGDYNYSCKLYSFVISARYNYDGATRPEWCPLVDLGKHGDLIDRDELRAKFPEPKDMIDPQQALVHITGVWAEIDCADVVIESEDSE